MPVSLRLQPELEARIAEYCARTGLSKSAVIARGIQEFLDTHSAPTIFELYLEHAPKSRRSNGTQEQKSSVRDRYRDYVRQKHARRTGR